MKARAAILFFSLSHVFALLIRQKCRRNVKMSVNSLEKWTNYGSVLVVPGITVSEKLMTILLHKGVKNDKLS